MFHRFCIPTLLLITCMLLPSTYGERLMLPMTDGTKLATDYYVPEGVGPFPVIFSRTPYSITNIKGFANNFKQQGYAVVMQDTRGMYNSEGIYMAFEHDGWGKIKTALKPCVGFTSKNGAMERLAHGAVLP